MDDEDYFFDLAVIKKFNPTIEEGKILLPTIARIVVISEYSNLRSILWVEEILGIVHSELLKSLLKLIIDHTVSQEELLLICRNNLIFGSQESIKRMENLVVCYGVYQINSHPSRHIGIQFQLLSLLGEFGFSSETGETLQRLIDEYKTEIIEYLSKKNQKK